LKENGGKGAEQIERNIGLSHRPEVKGRPAFIERDPLNSAGVCPAQRRMIRP